jgi:hypothetical protein
VIEVTVQQRATVHTLCALASGQNKDVAITNGKGFSPFYDTFLERVEKVIEHRTAHKPLGAPANCVDRPSQVNPNPSSPTAPRFVAGSRTNDARNPRHPPASGI